MILITACGTGEETNETAPPITRGEEQLEETDLVEEHEDLAASVETDSQSFIFTVTNTKKEPIDITFTSGQEYDYIVLDSNGLKVKQLSEDMMYTQAIKEVTLEPKETLSYSAHVAEVADGLSPGNYTIQFIFKGSDAPLTATTEFEVQ